MKLYKLVILLRIVFWVSFISCWSPSFAHFHRQTEQARDYRLAGQFVSALNALGSKHGDCAPCHIERAHILYELGRLDEAEAILVKTFRALQSYAGRKGPLVRKTMIVLGHIYEGRGEYNLAEYYWDRYQIESEGRDSRLAYVLARLGRMWCRTGDFEKAQHYFQQADKHMDSATMRPVDHVDILRLKAAYHREQGAFDRASDFVNQAKRKAAQMLGQQHFQTVLCELDAAEMTWLQGDWDKAAALYASVSGKLETILERPHSSLANAHQGLARIALHQGQYDQAFTYATSVVSIREHSLGRRHLRQAEARLLLARIQVARNQYQEAATDISHALSILDDVLENKPSILKAEAFAIRAALAFEMQEIDTALAAQAKSYAMYVQLFGEDHPRVQKLKTQQAQRNSGGDGSTGDAIASLERTYQRLSDSVGAQHIYSMDVRMKLADALLADGQTAAAAGHYREILLLQNRTRFSTARDLIRTQTGLAHCAAKRRDWQDLTAHIRACFDYEDDRLNRWVISADHRERSIWFSQVVDRFITFFGLLEPAFATSAEAVGVGVEMLLRRKAIIQDLAISEGKARHALGEEQRDILLELQAVERELQTLTGVTEDAHNRLAKLNQQKRQLSQSLARAVGLSVQPNYSLRNLQARLPEKAVVIDMVLYGVNKPRYGAFLIQRDASPQWFSLGSAHQINQEIDAFIQAYNDRDQFRFNQANQRLSKRLADVFTAAGGQQEVWIAPTGAFHMVSFAVLKHGQEYAVESWIMRYLNASRDLFRDCPENLAFDLTIFANPDFGLPKVLRWPSLPHTRTEASAIVAQVENLNFNVIQGQDASEAKLKQLASPGILHIATHGYDRSGLYGDSALPSNDLLHSGLVLAHANQGGRDGEDGLFTAQEASQLNLSRTRLVVLNSCQSGTGRIRALDGIYGMRRAFQIAGAQNVIAALWPVDDRQAREFFELFYKNYSRQGEPGAIALRNTQLTFIGREQRAENQSSAFDWGGYLYLGLDHCVK